MRSLLLIFVITLASNGAYSMSLKTGSDLLKSCTETQKVLEEKSDNRSEAEACVHFLMGFDSGQAVVSRVNEVSGTHCQPKGSNVGDMVNRVVAYLEKNEDFHEVPAGIAAWQALESSWPCE